MSSEGKYEWKTVVVNEIKFQHQLFWSNIRYYDGLIHLLELTTPLYFDFHVMKVRKYQGLKLGSTVCALPAESYANKLISFKVFINDYQLDLSMIIN